MSASSKIQRIRRGAQVLDYSLGLGVLGYAIYAQSWLWGALGVLGLVCAHIEPAKLVEHWLRRRLTGASNQG